MTRYTRGDNWGQLDAVVAVKHRPARLLVYGSRGLVQTIVLDVRPGTQRVFE